MKSKIEVEEHYGVLVYTNVFMDNLRKEECLCLNCNHLSIKCSVAKALYEFCKRTNLAMAITRCPKWEVKKEMSNTELKNFLDELPEIVVDKKGK